jgi:hypothetical protein
MKRNERVLRLLPISISIATADAILEVLHVLATERVNREIEERLRQGYRNNPAAAQQLDPQATDENDFVQRHINDVGFRAATNLPTYETYTFLSSSGNVQYDDINFDVDDLPKDLSFLSARADGSSGRFVEIKLKTDFRDLNEVRNWSLNQLIVHGEDRDWVNATYERLRGLVEPEVLGTRKFIYGNALKLFWLSAVLLLFAEYRIAKWLFPGFNIQAPLSGTGALLMFGIVLGSLIAFGDFVVPAFAYFFPYFEVEKNSSRGRSAKRNVIKTVGMTIYSGALVNAVFLLFGPTISRLLGHQ